MRRQLKEEGKAIKESQRKGKAKKEK